MFIVYVLKSLSDGRLYVGCTEDLQARLKAHNSGKVRSTKGRRPLHLMYKEHFDTKQEMRKRENFLKSGQGRKFLKQLVT